jgi:ribosome maturation factor RimP
MSDFAPKSSHPFAIDRVRLGTIVDPIVRAHGGEVVDFELKSEANGWVLRVFVEKLGSSTNNASTQDAAVDLDLCTRVARELSPALDAIDLVAFRYHLEVSSPGVERPLRAEKDFVRFCGKKAKVKLTNAIKGQKVLVGIIGPVEHGAFTLKDGNQEYPIALDNVAQARLVFEFGPQPKPGKQKKK